jgi:hypothetical protein
MAGFLPRRERWGSLNVLAILDAVFVSIDRWRGRVMQIPLMLSRNWVELGW